MKSCFRKLSAAAIVCLASMGAPALGQVSNFTYQGKLDVAGVTVDGSADFRFSLFDSPTGGTQIGSTQSQSNLDVQDGRFATQLNFGSSAFNGQSRWLEIAVRSPSGSGNFVLLQPRQEVTPAPIASFSTRPWATVGTAVTYTGGNVGIGTNFPSGPLDVRSGSSSYVRVDGVNGDLHMNGGSDALAGIFNDSTSPNARLDFLINTESRMAINAVGNVGIGTTTPADLRRLTVRTPEIFTGRFESDHVIGSTLELSNTTGGLWEWGVTGNAPPAGLLAGAMYFYKNGEQDVALAIMPNQWVGVGVNNPGFRLDLPNIGNEDGRGRANRWDTYSSIRWKDNVQTLDNALEMVMQLRGVSFDWKAEHGGSHDIGFVAEEVGQVVPELVSWEADGHNAKGLAYDHLTALTVEAIKEQQGQIKALQQANVELHAQVVALMQRVAANEASK